jgi:Ca2+-binding RTX toxin-like protein
MLQDICVKNTTLRLEPVPQIKGSLFWQDENKVKHPLRGVEVDVRGYTSRGEIVYIGDVRTETDDQGFFTFEVTKPLTNVAYVLVDAYAEELEGVGKITNSLLINPNTKGPYRFLSVTSSPLAQSLSAPIPEKIVPFHQNPSSYIFSPSQVFSIYDALYVAQRFVEVVRDFPETDVLNVHFPHASGPSQSGTELYLSERDWKYWDTILHEYGHFLSGQDNFGGNPPRGTHNRGESQIPIYGKDGGVRKAWTEGIADYLSIAIQQVVAELKDNKGKSLLPNLPRVGNSVIEGLKWDDEEERYREFDVDIETLDSSEPQATSSQGEGDETAVSRILLDIADDHSDSFRRGIDEISIGHKKLYQLLANQISYPEGHRLEALWNYFFDHPEQLGLVGLTADASRAKLGAIFEEYGVSPKPVQIAHNPFVTNSVNPPFAIFWEIGNGNENDEFEVIVFNQDFSERLIEKRLTTLEWRRQTSNSAFWEPELDVRYGKLTWNELASTNGIYHLVITGKDRSGLLNLGTLSTVVDYPENEQTGFYWSGALTFATGNGPLLAKPIADQSINEDSLFYLTIPADTFAPRAGDLNVTYSAIKPPWLNFDPASRTFAAFPFNEHVGSYNIQVIATGSSFATATDSFTLTVKNVNDAPTVINPIADRTTTTNTRLSFPTANPFTDIDVGDVLTYTAIAPAWLSFDAASLTFSGTTPNGAGDFNIQVIATDQAGASVTDSFTLTVKSTSDDIPGGRTGTAPPLINFRRGKRGIRKQGSNRSETMTGQQFNDVLRGMNGNDRINGLNGKDQINGGNGSDRINGGSGSDLIEGTAGNDYLLGGAGDDVLVGGPGLDTLTGGGGRDVFVFTHLNGASDRITDFNSANDWIDLRAIFARAEFSGATPYDRFVQFVQLVQVGASTEIRVDADGNGSQTVFIPLATLNNTLTSRVSSRSFIVVSE